MPQKKERGRPSRPMPEVKVSSITPEDLADIIVRAKPKKTWRYLTEAREARDKGKP